MKAKNPRRGVLLLMILGLLAMFGMFITPANAIRLTKAGLLWDGPLFGVSLDTIINGLVSLDECVNVPDDMRAFIVKVMKA